VRRREAVLSQMCYFGRRLCRLSCARSVSPNLPSPTEEIYYFTQKCGVVEEAYSICSYTNFSLQIVKTTAPELRQLIPKAARPSVSQIALQVKRNPHPGIIMTEVENRYFAVFYNDLAKGFGGAYYSSIWQRLIPQMGEVEPFIRHATVALGALTKSSVPMIQNQKPLRGSPLQDPHHMFAMKAYCKALKGIRESMSQNRGDIRSALLASLLAFCFESMQGHETAAFSHAVGGVTLFQNWQKEHSNSNVMEVDDLAFTFAGLVCKSPSNSRRLKALTIVRSHTYYI